MAPQQLIVARWAFFIERNVRLARFLRALHKAARRFAIRISRARKERAETAALDDHFFAAVVAILRGGFRVGLVARDVREIANEIAFGIARAAEEKSVAADALEQFALAALLAFFARGDAGLVGIHLIGGFVEVHFEAVPEFFHRCAPGQFAVFDFIELFFEARGEANVENVFEGFHKQAANALAQ